MSEHSPTYAASTDAPRIPAEVFHPAQMIADEAMVRGWSIWDFADLIATLDAERPEAPVLVLACRLYATSVGMEPRKYTPLFATFATDMERVFGISAEVWRRTEALCKDFPGRVAPLDQGALDWYEMDEENGIVISADTTGANHG